MRFEVIAEKGEGAECSGDRATVYKRLQSELIQQTRVSVVTTKFLLYNVIVKPLKTLHSVMQRETLGVFLHCI